jgi:hypothetical protein
MTEPSSTEAPWHAGLRAARANLVPGLLVQGIMVATVLAYYFLPGSRGFFDELGEWKSRWGYTYSSVSAILAGAVVPEILRILVFQKGVATRQNLGNFLFAAVFWGYSGMQVDFFYRMQAVWFGSGNEFATVVKKVLVDQLLYCPILAAPMSVILYDWWRTGFRLAALPGFFTRDFYLRSILPTLLANWGVWIPIVAALYSLPGLLQIPLFSMALSLWVILFTWMSEQRAAPAPAT